MQVLFVRLIIVSMSNQPYDNWKHAGILPISWDDFHGLCKALAAGVRPYAPEIILAAGRGGHYAGTLIAHMLRVEIFSVRLTRRVLDVMTYATPQWMVEPPALVAGRRILVVDEVSSSGETVRMIAARARELGAAEVRIAVMYAHTPGVEAADYIGLISDALILNPWDREVLTDAGFQFHPEYVAAMAEQGLAPNADLFIPATPYTLAKTAT